MAPGGDQGGPDPQESRRKAAATDELIGLIGLARGGRAHWWNLVAYRELGDRTPTQAWLAGDEGAVRELVERWYRASVRARDRVLADPDAVSALRARIEDLDRRRRPTA